MKIWSNLLGFWFEHPKFGSHHGPFLTWDDARIAYEGEQLLSYLN